MKGGSRWLLAALASAAVHAGGAGALWAMRTGTPAQEPLAIAPEPMQVALFTVTRPSPAAASPADERTPPASEARPARAPRRSPPAPPAATEPSEPTPSASLAPPAPSAMTEPSEPRTHEATLDASGAAATAAPSGGEGTGSGEGEGASPGGGKMTAGSGGTGRGTRAEDLRPLTEALRRSAQRCYPAAAARYRLTGTASISFCVEPGGRFSALRLERSSGHALLDRAAVSCVVPGAVPLRASPGCFTLPVAFEPGR